MTRKAKVSRRTFFRKSASTGGAVLLLNAEAVSKFSITDAEFHPSAVETVSVNSAQSMPDLGPARWIWYPSARCLPNTFVLFRRELKLSAQPSRARGWIMADSRYLLIINGRRIQWGPAPSDPRYAEIDPLDLTQALQTGPNVIGAQVLHYGQGDGTWPAGKPGFLFWLEIETADGRIERIVSDAAWQVHLARSWKPGQYKRWYLRALQEEFDARLYPDGWATHTFTLNSDWLAAMPLNCPNNKPPISSSYPDYQFDTQGEQASTALRVRSIPLLRETLVPISKLTESSWLKWRRPPEEYFECLTPNAFEIERQASATQTSDNTWQVNLEGERAAALTFELKEQIVGFPRFTIEAPANTVVELLVQESHQPGGPVLLNTHFHSWTRFTCLQGINHFETFDFESCRFIQLHIRSARGQVIVSDVGVRRRMFPWPNEPHVSCSDPKIQQLANASINTLHNSAQETIVDGMGRERQQYSGDVGHQLHAIYAVFGEKRLPARYLSTFSQGMTVDGYFLDCWPAYDRLARLAQRQMQLTKWGPILDHGVGFNFDCLYHYLYTGELQALAEPFPRLLRFAAYLRGIRGPDGLLPVEDIGVPSVWMDHQAYRQQRHKQCAFNLYAAAMLEHALAPVCRAFGDRASEAKARQFGRELLAATIKHFWSADRGLFVNNLPWLQGKKADRKETGISLCDRSLATAVLFDQCPGNRTAASVRALAEQPPEMGFSYPANAGWRLWALAKAGRIDVVLNDLRTRWARMASVVLNNTLQEDWTARPDSGAQWSHCPVAPLYVLYMSIAGIRPLAPAFARCEIRPQLGDLEHLELTAHTAGGPLLFKSEGTKGKRTIAVTLPPNCEAELVLKDEERIDLQTVVGALITGHKRYQLPAGKQTILQLAHT